MQKNFSEEREALYQMICSMKDDDIQKVVSYVSFLRFVDVYKDKAMADLLKIELSKNDLPKAALPDSLLDTSGEDDLPSFEFPYGDDPAGAAESDFKEDEDFYMPARSGRYDPDDEPAASAFTENDDRFQSVLEPQPVDFLSFVTPPFPDDEPDAGLTEREPAYEDPGTLSSQVTNRRRMMRAVKSFRLNFADLAFIFQVSPPMVRTWFSGAELGAEEEMQMQYLLDTAECVEIMNIPRMDHVLRQFMPDGEFFLEKLRDRNVTGETLKTLQGMAERAEKLRRKFKGAAKPFYAMQHAIGLYATPLYCEG